MTEISQPHPLLNTRGPLGSKETLVRSLDELLERYLNLLDEYQKLRQILNDNLSSGYISLAQANFSNPNRIRYGQDYYDDRMQASTHVTIESENPYFRAVNSATANYLDTPITEKQDLLQPSSNANPRDPGDTCRDAAKDSKTVPDPLNWFGILVPPALRASQKDFKIATIKQMPALASLAKELRELEIDVRRIRKKLGKAS